MPRKTETMNTQTTTKADAQKALEKLLDAAGALTMAHDEHINCQATIDDYSRTFTAYQTAKDQLAALAITYTRTLEAAAGIA